MNGGRGGDGLICQTREGVFRAAAPSLPPGDPSALPSGTYPQECPGSQLRLLVPASRRGGQRHRGVWLIQARGRGAVKRCVGYFFAEKSVAFRATHAIWAECSTLFSLFARLGIPDGRDFFFYQEVFSRL